MTELYLAPLNLPPCSEFMIWLFVKNIQRSELQSFQFTNFLNHTQFATTSTRFLGRHEKCLRCRTVSSPPLREAAYTARLFVRVPVLTFPG